MEILEIIRTYCTHTAKYVLTLLEAILKKFGNVACPQPTIFPEDVNVSVSQDLHEVRETSIALTYQV